jgi:small subunit ribosomal protein S14
MTASSHEKVFKQLKAKPEILKKFLKHNAPKNRRCGINLKRCKRCGRTGAHISKYGLHLCRQCYREIATKMGFKQYS